MRRNSSVSGCLLIPAIRGGGFLGIFLDFWMVWGGVILNFGYVAKGNCEGGRVVVGGPCLARQAGRKRLR
jgi:hypothetical protein